MITPGFRLLATWVIHTVGPVWQGGAANEAALLAACYRACLAYVASHAITTMAFPSISTGRYRFPIDQASQIAVQTCQRAGEEYPLLRDIDCVEFLNAWNLLGDIANSVNLPFIGHSQEAHYVYDNIFWGNNLPAVTPAGKQYTPRWSDAARMLIRQVLDEGLGVFRAVVKRGSCAIRCASGERINPLPAPPHGLLLRQS